MFIIYLLISINKLTNGLMWYKVYLKLIFWYDICELELLNTYWTCWYSSFLRLLGARLINVVCIWYWLILTVSLYFRFQHVCTQQPPSLPAMTELVILPNVILSVMRNRQRIKRKQERQGNWENAKLENLKRGLDGFVISSNIQQVR